MAKFVDVECVLLCDDVRNEEGGKKTIVGLYGDELVTPPGIPGAVMPLCLFVRGRFTGNPAVSIECWLESSDGENAHKIEWAADELKDAPIDKGKVAQFVWKIMPWSSAVPATHKVHFMQDGQDEVIDQFEVRAEAS